MPLPRVRFTVRRLMVAVAIMALTLGAIGWGRRMSRLSKEYLSRARDHEWRAKTHEKSAQVLHDIASVGVPPGEPSPLLGSGETYEQSAVHLKRLAEYHGRLRAVYMRAARWPFLPVAPDPPEPE